MDDDTTGARNSDSGEQKGNTDGVDNCGGDALNAGENDDPEWLYQVPADKHGNGLQMQL